MKEDIIKEIIKIEWDMFINTSNIGGRASCQEDPKTFKIMRTSQFVAFSVDVLKSYLKDLILAKKDGRNLVAIKYGLMMQGTHPQEYDKISHLLPTISKKKFNIINEIVKEILKWEIELSKKFPYITATGRPIYSHSDSHTKTSIETYLRGELSTYSFKTLILYMNNIGQQKLDNINASEITLLEMVKAYGYKSLKEANEVLKNQ
jgi:hypothetical protein